MICSITKAFSLALSKEGRRERERERDKGRERTKKFIKNVRISGNGKLAFTEEA